MNGICSDYLNLCTDANKIITIGTEPKLDGWGYDCFWGANEFKRWLTALIAAGYTKSSCIELFNYYIDKANDTQIYCIISDIDFKNWYQNTFNIDIANKMPIIYKPVDLANNVLDNTGNLLNNVIKYAIPFAIIIISYKMLNNE